MCYDVRTMKSSENTPDLLSDVSRTSENTSRPAAKSGKAKRVLLLLLVISLLATGAWFALPQIRNQFTTTGADGSPTVKATCGDLEIIVLEGGNFNALESLQLKSQVKTREGAKILSIVEEGYEVTAKDVEEGKVLIKLDPTEVLEKIELHDIEFENAQTELTDSDEARAIRATESQNEIGSARQKARFALLDFEKYMGEETARKVLALRNLPADEDAQLEYEKNFQKRLTAGKKSSGDKAILTNAETIKIDFSKFLEDNLLGDGEAQQEVRKRQDELLVAQSEHAVQIENIEGSERLKAKEYITKSTLDKEMVALKKAKIKELSAATNLELYKRYEYPKKAEELLTNYQAALRTVDIEKKEAMAKLAQADAKFRNAEQLLKLAQKKREELNEQLESCTISATKTGLVVYGASERSRYGGNNEKIEEGAAVNYKRTIITIPDMTRMGVKVSIQESHIKKVKVGQKVRLIADAEPDKTLTGEVKKVAVLPDSNHWYQNPNQKLYPTMIHIDGTHEWLKPGMSAKAEIIVNKLKDVIKIPVQCVDSDAGETVAWLRKNGKAVRTVVKTGEFNDEFIEIKEGLKEGDLVYLTRPGVSESDKESEPAG